MQAPPKPQQPQLSRNAEQRRLMRHPLHHQVRWGHCTAGWAIVWPLGVFMKIVFSPALGFRTTPATCPSGCLGFACESAPACQGHKAANGSWGRGTDGVRAWH